MFQFNARHACSCLLAFSLLAAAACSPEKAASIPEKAPASPEKKSVLGDSVNKSWSVNSAPCDLNGGAYETISLDRGIVLTTAGRESTGGALSTFHFTDLGPSAFNYQIVYFSDDNIARKTGSSTTITSQIDIVYKSAGRDTLSFEKTTKLIDLDALFASGVVAYKETKNSGVTQVCPKPGNGVGSKNAVNVSNGNNSNAANNAKNPNNANKTGKADKASIETFLTNEIGTLSTLDRAAQETELAWFASAAAPFRGMEINVVSENLLTHQYEARVLAPAFSAITGIRINHVLIGEADAVERLHQQILAGDNRFDAYVLDSDLLGTLWRYGQVRSLTDWIAGEGKDVTSPTLDLPDFIGGPFTTGPDKKLYQLPDQQFANLYWFRYDWFTDPRNKADFKARYGYQLGVPVNWSAYEDIAEFFTGRTINGNKVYGHMDYGKKDPSLGWRFTDAWLSMAGAGDKGVPNGLPVDAWGIRVDANSRPVGSCVTRGGDTNGPASVYAITKYLDWLTRYAPPAARGMTFSQAGSVPADGQIAQQIFWYTTSTAAMSQKGLPVTNADGSPKWRMAPSPHGAYWEEAQKPGYQGVGSWTLMANTPADRARAAWLYAQFVTSKTVDVKKSHVGLTFIRESTIQHKSFTDRAPRLGGLVEFYRSPARLQWSPAGANAPDYPRLSRLWWQNIGDAAAGAKSPQQSMNALCAAQEAVMDQIERSGVQGEHGPRLNVPQAPNIWFAHGGAPKPKLANEKPPPQTVDYDTLIQSWKLRAASTAPGPKPGASGG